MPPPSFDRVPIMGARVRRIDGSFAFLPHRFLREGFLASLTATELCLYVFLVLAADRHGLSFYHYDRVCSILEIDPDAYLEARNGLLGKDLIAFDGSRFQVLSLPSSPSFTPRVSLRAAEDLESSDSATIRGLIARSLADHEE